MAATPELLRADLRGSDALSEALRVNVPPSWPPRHFDRGAVRLALAMLTSPQQRGWWIWYFVERSGRRLVGAGGYKGAPAEGAVEIGYAVVAEHQRRGLATEAARGLTIRACADRRVDSVWAETAITNEASGRVLRSCGFVRVGEGSAPGLERFAVRR